MSTLEQRLNFIQSSSMYLLSEIYTYFRSWCVSYKYEDYIRACTTGDRKLLDDIFRFTSEFDLNEGLSLVARYGHTDLITYFIDHGATDLNSALKSACQHNRYNPAEQLVKKGADIVVGRRHSTSVNINRMLDRYEYGSEIIN